MIRTATYRMAIVAVLVLVVMASVAEGRLGPPVRVSEGAVFRSGDVAIARSGRQLVVWTGTSVGGRGAVRARVLDKNARPKAPMFQVSRSEVDGTPLYATGARAEPRGRRGEFLVVWSQGRPGAGGEVVWEQVARRFNEDGVPLSEEFVVASASDFEDIRGGEIVYSGRRREFLTTWQATDDGGTTQIYAAEIPGGGSEVAQSFRISARRSGDPNGSAFVAGDLLYDSRRDRYLVSWMGEYENPRDPVDLVALYARTLAADPSRRPGRVRKVSEDRVDPGTLSAVGAFNRSADEYVLVWNTRVGDDREVHVRRLRPDALPTGRDRELPRMELSLPVATDLQPDPGRKRYQLALLEDADEGERAESPTYVTRLGRRLRVGQLREISTATRSQGASLAYSRAKRRFFAAWAQGERSDDPEGTAVFVRSL
jgi:hypothetical protein